MKDRREIKIEVLNNECCTVNADNIDWEEIGILREQGYKAHYVVTEHSSKDYWVIWK